MQAFRDLAQWLPPEGVKILLVLFLSFLVGLEREELRASGRYAFGGVRTFPLIGLIGYGVALLSQGQLLPLAIGFAVISGFLMLSFHHKLSTAAPAGVTSEMSGLIVFIIGALVSREYFWIATAICVASTLLLELKVYLEKLTTRIAPDEILTFTKFLLITVVILPVLPNTEFGPFAINPFKTWLVVVAVSTVSYGSYVIQRMTKAQGGVVLAAILGGAYSSTVTTIVIARRAKRENHPHLFSGGTLIASGMMYARLIVLLALFNRNLMLLLAPSFAVLAGLAIAFGWIWSRRADAGSDTVHREYEPQNPLEMRAALLFAILFLAILIATHLAAEHLGKAGVFTLAAIMGIADVDPFIMGMTQSAGTVTTFGTAAVAVLIAASSNNIVKGIYAYSMSDRRTGVMSLCLLVSLALLGLLPLMWL